MAKIMIKGILLDLDNTLYDYDATSKVVLEIVAEKLAAEFNIAIDELKKVYYQARKEIHAAIPEQGASHNRLLYFQRMFEILGVKPKGSALKAYRLYWDTFVRNIKLFDGVKEFFEVNTQRKIAIVTDLTADVQHKKITDLKLWDYIDCLVSSEEVGKEKPDEKIFLSALDKLRLGAEDVCMIGDSYEKDIIGAVNLGIRAIWLNRGGEQREKHKFVSEVSTFKDILNIIQ